MCNVERESTKLVCLSRSHLEEHLQLKQRKPLSYFACRSLNQGAHAVWWRRGKEERAWQVKFFFWKPLKHKKLFDSISSSEQVQKSLL